MKRPIKDFYNKVIGYIEEKPNGDIYGYDYYNRLVGIYEKRTDLTKDFYRKVVGHGNLLSALIYKEGNK